MLEPRPGFGEQRADMALRRDRMRQQRARDDGRQHIAHDGRRDAPRAEPRELDRPIQVPRSAQRCELAWSARRVDVYLAQAVRNEQRQAEAQRSWMSSTHRSTQGAAPQAILPPQVLEDADDQVQRQLSAPRERRFGVVDV